MRRERELQHHHEEEEEEECECLQRSNAYKTLHAKTQEAYTEKIADVQRTDDKSDVPGGKKQSYLLACHAGSRWGLMAISASKDIG